MKSLRFISMENSSSMTGIAIEACLTLPVAGEALAHGQIPYFTGLIHRLYGAVTGLARDPRAHMRPVFKVNKIRHRGDFLPLDRFLLLPVLLQFLHLRLTRSRNLVAAHAPLDRRYARHRRSPCERMTILASDLEIPCVDLMAKGNGLWRAGGITGKGQPDSNRECRKAKKRNPDEPRFHSTLFLLTEAAYVSNQLLDLLVL